jgi:hypothetical protein
MELLPSAQKRHIAWYHQMAQHPLDGIQSDPWKSRLATVCLKLSMIYQVDQDQTPKIGPSAMDRACEKATELLHHISRICQEELAVSWFDVQAKTIRRLLRKYEAEDGWVDYKILLRGSHLKSKEFDEIIGTLLERDDIELESSRGRGTRPRRRIRLWQRQVGEEG